MTHQCLITRPMLESMAGKGKHGSFLQANLQFYMNYHVWEIPALRCALLIASVALSTARVNTRAAQCRVVWFAWLGLVSYSIVHLVWFGLACPLIGIRLALA